MPVITALRERPRDRVEIHLDETAWRVVPADAVVRAGLVAGRVLDRETARSLARELRRARALTDAVRVLRYADVSKQALDDRLRRRGAGASARHAALDTLERAGLVDDARVAAARARSLADRGYGDAAIRYSLTGEQVAADLVEAAVEALEPERDRLARLVERHGRDPKAIRRLAAKGFDAEMLHEVAGFADDL
jgi:SOS response regulatory protein OraA/RecX